MAAQTSVPGDESPSGFETFLGSVGGAFLEIAATTGGMVILLARIVSRLFPPRLDQREGGKNLYKMAVKSPPVVGAAPLFPGAIKGIPGGTIVASFGAPGPPR